MGKIERNNMRVAYANIAAGASATGDDARLVAV
jgi:hypothetical protein